MRAVVDTNVIISGVFFSGLPRKVLERCVAGQFSLAVSTSIIDEYRRVAQQFGGVEAGTDVEKLMGFLLHNSIVVEDFDLPVPICRDPGDDKFIACALVARADVIVSGDKDLLVLAGRIGVPVMTPRAFMAALDAQEMAPLGGQSK